MSAPPAREAIEAEKLRELARTAVHEAAHLVVAELYPCRPLEIHAVSIADAGPFAGGLIAEAPSILRRSEVEGLSAVLLAGFEAEWRYCGEPAFEHAVTDLRQAYVLIRALAEHAGTSVESHWREIQVRVRELLQRHWSAVEHLAVALVRHTVVDGARARAIVRRCTPPPLPGGRRTHRHRTPPALPARQLPPQLGPQAGPFKAR